MKYKKIVCVVIDSFGIGQATDAKEFDVPILLDIF